MAQRIKLVQMYYGNLGAEVITLGTNPDGFNINQDCGSTYPQHLSKAVIKHKADIGIALDGDADRLIIADAKGKIIDGDQIIALIAEYWQKNKLLKGNGVVTTKMSNIALETHLSKLNLNLKRTDIGDRYVTEFMKQNGYNVGGEQSGHIILTDYSTTGDGLIAALQVLAVMVESDNKFSTIFTPLPQTLVNVKIGKNFSLEDQNLKEAIKEAEVKLGANGRILVRKSGTEPLVRIMVEGPKLNEINKIAEQIAKAIKADNNLNKPSNLFNNVWKNLSNSWFRFRRGSRNSSRH